MLKSKLFYVIFALILVAIIILYKKNFFHKEKNEVAYFMDTTSEQKNSAQQTKLFGTLIMTSGLPNSENMASGLLCVENSKNLEKVDLYMPDMGHGSEPPILTSTHTPNNFLEYSKTKSHFGCYSITSMQLFMPGLWQVRVFYKDGVTGIFSIKLEK